MQLCERESRTGRAGGGLAWAEEMAMVGSKEKGTTQERRVMAGAVIFELVS